MSMSGEYVFSGFGLFTVLINIGAADALIILVILLIKSLVKHLKTESIHKEQETKLSTLGECLREKRIEMKMTQEYVAEKIGVTRQAVAKWENDQATPNMSNLSALARLYNIPTDELIKSLKR